MVEGWDYEWFWEKLGQRLGDVREMMFWEGAWSGEKMLKVLFPRLFNLSTNKKGRVQEMERWVEGKWIWDITWRITLF